MKTIALVNQKGGVGKTALACNLAVYAAETGLRVIAIDLDEQGSLSDWGRNRPKGGNLAVAMLRTSADLPAMLKALEPDYDLVILDAPGKHDSESALAISVSDLVLIPSRPSTPDIKASVKTVRSLVSLDRPYAFILNQCPTVGLARVKAGAAALALLGDIAAPFIGQRIDFQDATTVGQGVVELAPEGRAATEIRQLWAWIATRIANAQENAHVSIRHSRTPKHGHV